MAGPPDYLKPDLKIVFIGYNPGERSALVQHHFAGRNNHFYQLLFDAGLTPRLYLPEEDGLLLDLGYGFTNLVARPTRSSSELSPAEMREGAAHLRAKMVRFRPKIACFLGKDVYRYYAAHTGSKKIEYGPVAATTRPCLFVAYNPSGRSTVKYEDKLKLMINLRELAKT